MKGCELALLAGSLVHIVLRAGLIIQGECQMQDVDQHERWERVGDDCREYHEFDRVENKRSERPDLHAFLLLDELFPNPGGDLVACAEHDEIWLDVSDEQAASLTDEQILELTRCGVRYDEHGLCMFV